MAFKMVAITPTLSYVALDLGCAKVFATRPSYSPAVNM